MAKKLSTTKKEKTQTRPPIVAVLGHIDHGKTTLLDKIRQTNVALRESGGITQHIGAYQIKLKSQNSPLPSPDGEATGGQANLKTITFIDTPGHAAFAKMRSRGAQVADLAILVVAANEGVKAQTIESLKFIRAAKLNFLVAVTKMDLPNISLEIVEKELNANGIKTEKQKGEVVVVPVSAKTGKGIGDLLEMILLLGEMMDLKANPGGELEAVVIESKLDSHRGYLATILVRNGSLKIGETIKVENLVAKIKAMSGDKGQPLAVALPSQPAEILGFKGIPAVGAKVEKTDEAPEETWSTTFKKPTIPEKEESGKFKLILKADTAGTLEALKLSLPPEVEVIDSGVGDVIESEVLLAKEFKAEIFAFRVRVSPAVLKLAQTEKVKISLFDIIYKLIEEAEKEALKAMELSIDETLLGRAEILQEFQSDKRKIAGCRVLEGKIKKGDKVHLLRAGKEIGTYRISSMKTGKEKISGAKADEEFGAILSPSVDFLIGDVLTSIRKPKDND
jgi:translation initiation factor IF-2